MNAKTQSKPRARKIDTPAGVHRVETPMPFDGIATVNCYLVEHPLTLIDCGLNMDPSKDSLLLKLDELGYALTDIERIIITHVHPDHYGKSEWVRQESGAEVFVHEYGLAALTSGQDTLMAAKSGTYRTYLGMLGLDVDDFDTMKTMQAMMSLLAPPVSKATPVTEGHVFEFENYRLEVMHCPGHTRELICLHEPDKKFIFSNDHLLQETSPNPILDLGPEGEEDYSKKFRSLVSYYEQIERVRQMEFSCVLPGHGSPFVGHEAVIESLMYFYGKRQDRIYQLIEKNGEMTVAAICAELFPENQGVQKFLAASELLGNLEIMEHQGQIRQAFDGQYIHFSVA